MTIDYMMVRTFPNGQSYKALKLYASEATALAGCKRLFRDAEPGETLTLVRKGGEVAFKLERPVVLECGA